ncbi:MAG: DUF4177 domain-containing protein [Pseudomonadota bacterium]
MHQFEYKVVPAPTAGLKVKGISTPEGRFAQALQMVLNDLAGDGWEFLRAESLPSMERTGLTAKTTRTRYLLVFRRPQTHVKAVEETPLASVLPLTTPQTPEEDASQSAGARQMLRDNGVEELSEVSGLTNSLQALAHARNKAEAAD